MAPPIWPVVSRIPWLGNQLFLLFDRRRQLESAAAVVASELEFNAEAVGHVESGGRGLADLKEELRIADWTKHKTTLHALSRRHPTLWTELDNAYARLERTVSRLADPPSSDTLTDLANRLRAAKY